MNPRGFLSNSVVYGLGSVANRLIGLLFLPVFTRYLTPGDYGVVGILASLAVLFVPVFSFGLSTSLGVCFFGTASDAERAQVVRSGQLLCTLSAALLLLLAAFGSAALAALALSDARYAPHTAVALVGIALSVLALPRLQRLQFEARAFDYVAVTLCGVGANVVASLVAVVLLDLGALGLLFGTTFGQAVTWLRLVRVSADSHASARAHGATMKDLLRHGLPMIPSFAMLFAQQNGVRWPLEWQHGLGAVGIYSLGASIGTAITIVTTSVSTAWMPHALAQAPRWSEARFRLADDLLRYTALASWLAVLFFLGAQPVMVLLAPGSFFDSWAIIGASAASHVLLSLFSMILPAVYLAKKVSVVLVAQAVALVCTILAIAAFGAWGPVGAAVAVLTGSLVLVLAQWLANGRIRSVEPLPLSVPAFVRIGAVVAVAGIASFHVRVDDPLLFVVASASLASLATACLLREIPGGWRSILNFGGKP
jgi:O-antigen/teichoic acid export membrane protein